jgi:glucose/arabinose dehydrogenase
MLGRSKALARTVALAACGGASISALAQSTAFTVTELADFDTPWAMAFLPDERLLVSEQRGALKLYAPSGAITEISGVPEVSYGGQGQRARVHELRRGRRSRHARRSRRAREARAQRQRR